MKGKVRGRTFPFQNGRLREEKSATCPKESQMGGGGANDEGSEFLMSPKIFRKTKKVI